MVICLEQSADDLHIVQLMPLPAHDLLFHYNPEWCTLLVPAYRGCPGKRPLIECLSVVFMLEWHKHNRQITMFP